MNKFIVRLGAIISALVLGLASVAYFSVPKAQAIDTSLANYLNGQYYNDLVSDTNFLAINSMDVNAIQAFLVSKGSYLASASSDVLGVGANGRSAAQIIYDAAHALDTASSGCSGDVCINQSTGTISPKAILITLQKEQSLMTWPNDDSMSGRLRKAMGYGCPDGKPCDTEYYGFTNQVGWGAWQLKLNTMKYELGRTDITGRKPGMTVSFSGSDGNETRSVYLSNKATTALYSYTPYLYNGNYNFWKLGIEWFGFAGSSVDTPSVDDTSAVTGQTYGNSFKISGSKQTTSKVYFGSTLVSDAGPSTWEYSFSPNVGNVIYYFEYKDANGSLIATKPVTIERHKTADINGDGKVDVLDLSILGSKWNQTVKDDDWASLNSSTDNVINILDLSILASNWEG